MQQRSTRRNIGFLLRFFAMLVGLIALYSILFHFIMQYEGRSFSWVTGVYWTLTVMSTLGFGDITFTSDLGRIFSIVVLMSGVFLLLVMRRSPLSSFFTPRGWKPKKKGIRPAPFLRTPKGISLWSIQAPLRSIWWTI